MSSPVSLAVQAQPSQHTQHTRELTGPYTLVLHGSRLRLCGRSNQQVSATHRSFGSNRFPAPLLCPSGELATIQYSLIQFCLPWQGTCPGDTAADVHRSTEKKTFNVLSSRRSDQFLLVQKNIWSKKIEDYSLCTNLAVFTWRKNTIQKWNDLSMREEITFS